MGIHKLTSTAQSVKQERIKNNQNILHKYPGFVRSRLTALLHKINKDASLQGTERVFVYGFNNVFPYEIDLSLKGIEFVKKQGYQVSFSGNFTLTSKGITNIFSRYDSKDKLTEYL